MNLTPKHLYQPQSEQQVLDIMERHAGDTIRCVSRLHSWNDILQSPDILLDLRHLNDVHTDIDDFGRYAVVGGGCQIKHLIHKLNAARQWTLPSLGLITEQTIAGAISTGTHGSG
ncbi:FAD-dependent oxidoreductase [bacterium]|nr:FAD-dependent oxidoreductase [bacterium]